MSRSGMVKIVVAVVAMFAIGLGLILHESSERKTEATRLREEKLEPAAREVAAMASDGRPALAALLRELADRAKTGSCNQLRGVFGGIDAVYAREKVAENATLEKRIVELMVTVVDICKREE